MSRPLVIVESPTKARTIARYLGSGFVVESSIGHVRDLPSGSAEIPEKYKTARWSRFGVDVENGFQPLYIVPDSKKKQVTKLRELLKGASELYLATDEDREGEAIAWHLTEVLKPKVPVKRMVFHEITESAIRQALAHPRALDQRLVDAQQARRVVDRLYGYGVSEVLWRKVRQGLSAGRVQSVAVRLVVDRERERMRFVAASYWDVDAELAPRAEGKSKVAARLVELAAKRVATGKDFDATTGALVRPEQVVLLDEPRAAGLAERLRAAELRVESVTEKPFTERPYPPFITSTLQQEAGRKLRYSAKRTMRVAQELYENGYITYMRTDSTNLSAQAVSAARAQAVELYGESFIPDQPRTYSKKVKGAQEAHEAIRPAGERFRTPESLKGELGGDAFQLYDLIWKRTIASQMKDARGSRTTVRMTTDDAVEGTAVFQATGKVIHFPGFRRAYVEGSDDPEAELADQERVLPQLAEGEVLDPLALTPRGHTTQPPARFTEASLIKELEERGIGRPSTYAAILQTIQDRGYVWKKGSALVPTLTAFAVTNLLEQHFADLVDLDFTARMEEDLDAVAAGDKEASPWLERFYFGDRSSENGDVAAVGLKRRVETDLAAIDAREVSSIPIGVDDQGRAVVARVGRFGPYLEVGGSELRAGLPDDTPPDELDLDRAQQILARAAAGDRVLGQHPEAGKPVLLKDGRFGPYVQLGEPERTESGKLKKGVKPQTASLWPGMSVETVTLDDALKLLSYPRELGRHPESQEPVVAHFGQYGPYVRAGKETRSLEGYEELEAITLEGALAALSQPKRRGGMRNQPLKVLGKHPSGGELEVRSGRFGPYVTDGVVNASLPRGRDPESLTLEDALALIEAREEKLREQGVDPRAPKPKKGARKSPSRTDGAGTPRAARKTGTRKTGTRKTGARKAAPRKSSVAGPAGGETGGSPARKRGAKPAPGE